MTYQPSADPRYPCRIEEARPLSTRNSHYITPEGHRRLREERDQLWTVERPRVTNEVSVAAAQGDRSENAEYIYGKKRLREIDARLRYLSKRLDDLQVVEAPPSRRDRIFFGAWVVLEEESGGLRRYRIVGPDESDAASGRISIDSPVARALLGRQEGDEVRVSRPRGAVVLTVLEIAYEPPDGVR